MARTLGTFLVFVLCVNIVKCDILLIRPGVYSYSEAPFDYTSMFVITGGGVIVFEPVRSSYATNMLAAIATVTNEPVKLVIISHNHNDHASGGQVFKDVGAKIVVHEETAAFIRASDDADLAEPDIVWECDRTDIILGNSTVELRFMGINHGI